MKLKDWLARESLTETAFASRVGCSPSTINRLCRGYITPSRSLLRTIAEKTDFLVQPNDFFPEAVAASADPAVAA